MAHRTGDQAYLPHPVAGRSPPRRRLPALHEEIPGAVRRQRARGLRQDRRADGIGAPHREAAAPDQPARQQGAVPQRHGAVAPAGPGLAREMAGRADPLRRRLGEEGHRTDPAQYVAAVRAHLRKRAGPEPLPQGAERQPARPRRGPPGASLSGPAQEKCPAEAGHFFAFLFTFTHSRQMRPAAARRIRSGPGGQGATPFSCSRKYGAADDKRASRRAGSSRLLHPCHHPCRDSSSQH
ncbi:hypothetical protein CBM2633_A10377 [Cupriavidus taiwanensis]|uniref:Uncharacterized protein n=1 Tax=Cupriavidus taiwanensis TaxID=164546 RepID=A0A375DYN5_9BURK|nr:hypothetical protein CBM2615_A20094 [Cupriavidus taiwanensis]SOZ53349.1 hypothetical protein CBM2614_A20093 [Cupriavidus taiwanensis]SOZ55125.1 hypothetical protein CBM2613_A20095 [Cupriavidus taiwanensis]SPA05427.1 hypothetical protein CBM2625_A20096 [Cupriavidus taiwanensis]SPA10913.1 hypothetical protein CBM2633_A10377 [Cupriavidus taiwanensis]